MVSLSSPAAPNEKSFKLVTRANDLFERHLYSDAVTEYTKVLDMSRGDADYLALIYCNRSASYLKLNQYQQSQKDSEEAIELAPHWPKVRHAHTTLVCGN